MALADIISRLGSDAENEAAAILDHAEQRAAAIREEAAQKVAAHHAEVLAGAKSAAAKESARVVVSARLAERDASLAERRALISNALAQTALALSALPEPEYVRFLAHRIAGVARNGDTVLLGTDDVPRRSAVADALKEYAPDLGVSLADSPAPFDRGAFIEGHRVRADLSLTAIVEEQRDALELIIASKLFGEGA